MATRKNLKKTGKKRIKPKGGAKKRKTVRGGMWSWTKPKPKLPVAETAYSPFHDQTKHCDDEAMELFTDLINFLNLINSSRINKKYIDEYIDAWISDVDKNQTVKESLQFCRDKDNRSLLYHVIRHEFFYLIPFLIEDLKFKPKIEDIEMEIKLFLSKDPYQNYEFKNNKSGSYKLDYDKHKEIMDLLVTETAPQVDLDYIIGLATCKTPNILIILTMLKEKDKLSINGVSRIKQCKLLLILFNMNDSYSYINNFGLPKYFELLEFIISKFNFDLNEKCEGSDLGIGKFIPDLNKKCEGSDPILHTLVKEYFTTFTDFTLIDITLSMKKQVFFEKINFLIKHHADINIKNKDDKTIFDLFKDIKTDNIKEAHRDEANKRQKDYETEFANRYNKQNVKIVSEN